MPELPEVETVVKFLIDEIKGLKIKQIDFLNNKFLKNTTEENFKDVCENKIITKVTRKGKYILFHLSNDYIFISHLRMEGYWRIISDDENVIKHDHIIFHLDNGNKMVYNDSRAFGTIHLIKSSDIDKEEFIAKIAIDPFSNQLTPMYLFDKLKNKKINIKTVLMDQEIISGIGNIYASEILFSSKINPLIEANKLSIDQLDTIIKNTISILKKAITFNGTTVHSFTFGFDSSGSFAQFLNVYGRGGQPCKVCQNKIIKIKDHGRSTFYCNFCQK